MSGRFKVVAGMLLGLLALTLLLVWFLETFERATIEIDVGYSGEARRNRYLAAARLLERLGLQATSVKNLYELGDELPPEHGTIFLPVPRGALGQSRIERLQQWVEAGGHLLVVGRPGRGCRQGAHRDPLLDPLGVKVESPCDKLEPGDLFGGPSSDDDELAEESEASYPGSGDASPESDADRPDDADGPVADAPLATIAVPGRETPLRVNQGSVFWGRELSGPLDRALWAVPGRKGQRVLQYRLGRGLLTVLSRAAFMTNRNIGDRDHAELVWRLATWDGRRGPVYLIFGHRMPSLWSLLSGEAWMLLMSLGALLGLWLWSRAPRFGPVHTLPVLARRSLLEHIEACGHLLWRHGHARALLAAVRLSVRQRAARRIPQWQRLTVEARHERLAAVSELPVDEVRQVMTDDAPAGRAGFLGAMQRLERIRRSL